jgi:hypothetical protein
MKKVLLSVILLVCASMMFAQKTWNFSDAGKFSPQTYSSTTIVDGLKILASASATVTIDANTKKHGTYSFTQRLKLGGSGGFTAENRYMPTTRALVFQVSGPGTITVCCLSSSSSSDRRLLLTNGTDSISSFSAPGSYSDADGNNIPLETFNYTGGAATLYLYSVNSGVNIYLLDVSSAINMVDIIIDTPIQNTFASFNGSEIVNTNGLSLEVLNASGNSIISSSAPTIATAQLPKGVYIVREVGTSNILKFVK